LFFLSCLIFVPPLGLNDASNSLVNVLIIGVVCGGHWFGSYRNEYRDRLVWELQRRLDTCEQMDALLRLVFPAVVLVSPDGLITPSDALKEQFGVAISTLENIPTQDSKENLRDDLGELVKEVLASRIPAKRNVMIRPRGGRQVFLCTACVASAKSDCGVHLAFDIHDTWESTSATQAERQAFYQRGQASNTETADPRTIAGTLLDEGQEDPPRNNFFSNLAEGQFDSEMSEVTSDDESLSTTSVDESIVSEVSDSARKKVSFQARQNQSGSSQDRKKTRKCRKAPMPASFKIASSDLRYAQARRLTQVDFHTTAVDLLCRPSLNVDGVDISRELRVLLQCRHPNIVFVLGVAFDFPGGPVLVLEKTWGSVSRALTRGPLGSLKAMRIADQVNSAVHYLRKLRTRHGAVSTDNVSLLSSPRHANVIAKLTNFADATVHDNDQDDWNEDIYAFAFFTSNLFVDICSKCVAFDNTVPKEQLALMVSHNTLPVRVWCKALADMLDYIVSPDAICDSEVDKIFDDFHQVFQGYILAQSEQRAIQHDPQQGEGQLQRTPTREVAFRRLFRPADTARAPFSSICGANANSNDSAFPEALNLATIEFPERRFEEGRRGDEAATWQEWMLKEKAQ
jgi:hypothetical protein